MASCHAPSSRLAFFLIERGVANLFRLASSAMRLGEAILIDKDYVWRKKLVFCVFY